MTVDLALVDRDGVILRHVEPYILRLANVEVVPGSIRALRALANRGTKIGVVTNQSPVARGLITPGFVREVNTLIHRELGLGDELSFFFCPHLAEDECECRKPLPGLLHQAAAHFAVPISRAVMIGDHSTDVQAGISAGVARSARVRSGRTGSTPDGAFAEYEDLLDAYHRGFFQAGEAHPCEENQ